ncbi:hypothetical protein PV326_010044 [Microctonus aethiopoides]|nr:hypothetical protein PV326_010044 [Microctonus aethiopoides]
MLALERLRTRHFARSWALVQAAEALPILLGVPLTGYMNDSVPRVGYYACTLSSLCGAALLFLVGWGRQPSSPLLRASQLSHVSQQMPPPCACPPPPRPRLPKSQSLHVSLDINNDIRNLQAKQYQQQTNLLNSQQPSTPQQQQQQQQYPHQHQLKQCLDVPERVCPHSMEHYCQSGSYHNPLRPSKSVPEGLSNHEGMYKPRPRRYRDVTVIEQITTSV